MAEQHGVEQFGIEVFVVEFRVFSPGRIFKLNLELVEMIIMIMLIIEIIDNNLNYG